MYMCVEWIGNERARCTIKGKGRRGGGDTDREEEDEELSMLWYVCGNPYIAVWQQRSARQ